MVGSGIYNYSIILYQPGVNMRDMIIVMTQLMIILSSRFVLESACKNDIYNYI